MIARRRKKVECTGEASYYRCERFDVWFKLGCGTAYPAVKYSLRGCPSTCYRYKLEDGQLSVSITGRWRQSSMDFLTDLTQVQQSDIPMEVLNVWNSET